MDKKYRVVFLGLFKGKADFVERMSMLGVPPATVEEIVQRAPVVIKGDMSLRDARQYADAVQDAGGKVNIQEHGHFEETKRINKPFDIKPLENFIMCPECGHKQLKAEACQKCGLIFKEGAAGRK